MRKLFILLLITNMISLFYCSKPDTLILFPKREKINRQSSLFFKQIILGLPQLKAISFSVKYKNYFSAYINLSRILTKTQFFIDCFAEFEDDYTQNIETFNKIADKVNFDNYSKMKEEIAFDDFEIFTIILYRLYDNYKNNKLSGNMSYRFWNIILKISKATLKKKNLEWKDYAVLKLSSKLFFFKDKINYNKKSVKFKNQIKNQIKNQMPDNILLKYILNID